MSYSTTHCVFQVSLHCRRMSFNRQLISSCCWPLCDVMYPQPYADVWNEPCVTSCGDSRAVVYPTPVAITFLGPSSALAPQRAMWAPHFQKKYIPAMPLGASLVLGPHMVWGLPIGAVSTALDIACHTKPPQNSHRTKENL